MYRALVVVFLFAILIALRVVLHLLLTRSYIALRGSHEPRLIECSL